MNINDLNKGWGGCEERNSNTKAYKSFNMFFICSQHFKQNDITFQLLLLHKKLIALSKLDKIYFCKLPTSTFSPRESYCLNIF